MGNNSLNNSLRILASIELFVNANYYYNHPLFQKAVDCNFFSSVASVLSFSVSIDTIDSNLKGENLIKYEAKKILENGKWSSFVSMLALSSVLGLRIFTYYPDCGEEKYKKLFNQEIFPRSLLKSNTLALHILFCYQGTFTPKPFKPNHFVPLFFRPLISESHQSKFFSEPAAKKVCSDKLHDYSTSKSTIFKYFSACSTTVNTSGTKYSKPSTLSLDILPSTLKPSIAASTVLKSVNDINDIAYFKDKAPSLSDEELFKLINNVFTPSDDYIFPYINKRHFQKSWLKQFSWLRYSKSKNGAFCISCVLFGHRFPSKSGRIKKLYLEPLQSWNNALKDFRHHETTKNGLHEFTFPVFFNFCSQMKGKTQPIDVIMDSQLKEKIRKNRLILHSIVDTVIHCARTNSSFRGHRDDFKYLPKPGEWANQNIGVFNQTLNFAVRNGNTILSEHLSTCSKNATYISKTTQNELIKCCGQEISETILTQVKKARFYSIIADEACDSSTKEQMALVLRYVDEDNIIKEHFLRFIHCNEGLSGKDLSSVVLKCIKDDLGLDIMNCRGQGYDGAGSVSGYINGLSAQILNINSKALYTHCHSHRLNLTICESCNVPLVSDIFDKVREVSDFFNSSETRLRIVESNILSNASSTSKSSKLKDVCRTRWIERIDGLSIFLNSLPAIIQSFDQMSAGNKCNRDTKLKANTFSHCLCNFSFIFPLVVVTHSLEYTLPVTRLLQGRSIDILQGMNLIDSLKDLFAKIRDDIDTNHETWYKEAESIASSLDIPVTKSRTCSRQTNRVNVPSESVSQYFKRAVTIPFTDYMNSSLNRRFQPDSQNSYYGLAVIPSNLIKLNSSSKLLWKQHFLKFAKFYENDFPNFDLIQSELVLWEKFWESYSDTLPDTISTTLKAVSFPGFENIKIALRLLGTLPVTSCECERCFSALRRLKDYSRSTMTADRLNGLALMYVHKDIVPNIEKVIDRYSVTHRRLDF